MKAPFRTCLITDTERTGIDRTLEVLARVLEAGIGAVQVRERQMDARALEGFTRQVIERARPQGALVLVNGRADVALACGADGVHLGWGAIHPEAARELAHRAGRSPFLVGVSVHDLAQTARASAGWADYVHLGPVFATPSKAGHGPPLGVDAFRAVCTEGWLPVIAVGGVTPQNTPELLAAGAAGTACIRAVFEAQDPLEAVRSWVAAGPQEG